MLPAGRIFFFGNCSGAECVVGSGAGEAIVTSGLRRVGTYCQDRSTLGLLALFPMQERAPSSLQCIQVRAWGRLIRGAIRTLVPTDPNGWGRRRLRVSESEWLRTIRGELRTKALSRPGPCLKGNLGRGQLAPRPCGTHLKWSPWACGSIGC